jgi:DNA modification methylase
MNPNYAQRVKKQLNKLSDAQFIFPIETTQWLSQLVIVLKKNGKLCIYVDY